MNPLEQGEGVGLSPTTTRILGICQIAAAASIAFGIFSQIGAATFIVTMLGAIYKKLFKWKTGFSAEGGYGWH